MKTHLSLKKITAVAGMALACNFGYSQVVTPQWINTSQSSDYANFDVKEVSMALDSVGNVYTAASISDTVNNLSKTMLVKYNAAGAQQWIKYYDASGADNGSQAVALLVDKGGNSYVCGYGRHNNTTTIDMMVIKYDNAGNQSWVQYWDSGNNDGDYITCAAFDVAGNIVVGGYARTTTYDDATVLKFTTAGTLSWSYLYNNSPVNDEDRAKAIATDGLGNIFITGSSYQTKRDMITIKLNSAGTSQWINRMAHVTSGTDETGFSIVADAAGNAYATGVVGDWITMKYDAAGNTSWTHHYTADDLEAFDYRKILQDKHGDLIIAGDAFASSGSQADLIVEKLSSTTGSSQWSISMDNGGGDKFTDVALDTSANIYITGYFDGPVSADMSAAMFSSAGTLLWNSVYSNTVYPTGTDRPYQIAADQHKNIYVAGITERRSDGSVDPIDVVTMKYGAVVTGIAQQHLSFIKTNIYPNPAKENLIISASDAKLLGSIISIVNVTGQTVKQEVLTSLQQQVDVSQLTKGIYLVKVLGNNLVSTSKLIIE